MSSVLPQDRYTLRERLIDGPGGNKVDRLIGRFADPDTAYARLLATRFSYPEMYGGRAPSHRLIVRDEDNHG